ncbi:MAG: NAD-dependent epimerase/dehydratase family protein [Planctomycetes bacterium]|nr:NAD-dependent epimerase/dehydratase family protein [Planctomycetota bacterium]
MTWMITGGCGFVGANLADAMLAAGEDVVILDNLSRAGSRDNLFWLQSRHGHDWRFEPIDIRDDKEVSRCVRDIRPAVVAHLAGQVAMTTSLANPRLDFEVNALGTFQLLDAVRIHSPDSIVLYSSTNKVYGSLENLRYHEKPTRYEAADYPDGFDETLPLDGSSPYGCSKLCAEQYCRDFSRAFGVRTVVFRHSSMYGGRQFATFDQGWIGWFCGKAVEAERGAEDAFSISGNGKQVRDVLHADDLVRVYRMASDRIATTAGKIYNIGGGMANSLSLIELFDRLERRVGRTLRYRCGPWRAADQKAFVADGGRALADFGWRPLVDASTGLERMLEWSREMQPQ